MSFSHGDFKIPAGISTFRPAYFLGVKRYVVKIVYDILSRPLSPLEVLGEFAKNRLGKNFPAAVFTCIRTRSKTAITLTQKTVGRPSADLSADHRPIYRPIKCQISALFSSADKK